MIRPTCKRYNVIVEQWNKECNFRIQRDNQMKRHYENLLKNINKEQKFKLDKNTNEKKMIVEYENSAIDKTKKVKL